MSQCSCTGGNASLSGITVKNVYTGLRKDANSCSCEDFLVPRLQLSLPRLDINEICEVCWCGSYSKPLYGEEGITVESLTITVWFVTAYMSLFDFLMLKKTDQVSSIYSRSHEEIDENPTTNEEN
ncbi:hypothetical protein TNIN_381961 [Trichonephila inaurata madagascariensis]|uniref:Uncharacterized protein n=1 Tax=Trichonephila inaurata madagascariensis TaxID=2747483 RepID=A0A8X7CHQ3_9ARAC|nr:hypothetical protein TNIN_381961 [Trichonephila inaurata madagascariensis]